MATMKAIATIILSTIFVSPTAATAPTLSSVGGTAAFRQSNPIGSLFGFSSNGEMLFALGDDFAAHKVVLTVWDAQSGRLRHRIETEPGVILSSCYLDTTNEAAVIYSNGKITFFDVIRQKSRTIEICDDVCDNIDARHSGPLIAGEFLPAINSIVVLLSSGRIKVIDYIHLKTTRTLPSAKKARLLCVSADAKRFAAASENGIYFFTNDESWSVAKRPVAGGIKSISMSADGETLAYVTNDGKVYATTTLVPLAVEFELVGKQPVSEIAFLKDRSLVSLSDKTLSVWSRFGKLVKQIEVTQDKPTGIRASLSGNTVVIGGDDNRLHLFSTVRDKEFYPTVGHKLGVIAGCFQGDNFVSLGSQGDVICWDASTGNIKWEAQVKGGKAIASDQAGRLLVGGLNGYINALSDNGQKLDGLKLNTRHAVSLIVPMRPDLVGVSDERGKLFIVNSKLWKVTAEGGVPEESDAIVPFYKSAAWHKNVLLLGRTDGVLEAISDSLESKAELHEFNEGRSIAAIITRHNEGREIAVGDASGNLFLFEKQEPRRVSELARVKSAIVGGYWPKESECIYFAAGDRLYGCDIKDHVISQMKYFDFGNAAFCIGDLNTGRFCVGESTSGILYFFDTKAMSGVVGKKTK